MEIDEENTRSIPPADVDYGSTLGVRVSCYRESTRLFRVLMAYSQALHMADQLSPSVGKWFAGAVIELHDHKGTLAVTWCNREARERLALFIETAWGEGANEAVVEHAVIGEAGVEPVDVPPRPPARPARPIAAKPAGAKLRSVAS